MAKYYCANQFYYPDSCKQKLHLSIKGIICPVKSEVAIAADQILNLK